MIIIQVIIIIILLIIYQFDNNKIKPIIKKGSNEETEHLEPRKVKFCKERHERLYDKKTGKIIGEQTGKT